MSRLDAHDYLRILERFRSRRLGIHFVQVLFILRPHPATDDIDEGKNARDRAIDDFIFEVREIFPARAACVYSGSHSAAQGKPVRV